MVVRGQKVLMGSLLFLAVACATRETQPPFTSAPAVSDAVLNKLADSLYIVGSQLRKRGLNDSAYMVHRKALGLRLARRDSDLLLAYDYWRTGHLATLLLRTDAADTLSKAISLAERFGAPVDSLARMYLSFAVCKSEEKDFSSAVALSEHARKIVSEAKPVSDVLLMECMINLAGIHNRARKLELALDTYNKALVVAVQTGRWREEQRIYYNIAVTHSSLHQWRECMQAFDKALPLRIRQYGDSSSHVSAIYLNKGGVFQRLGHFDSARFYLFKCLSIRRRASGEKHFETAGAYEGLASLYEQMGNLDSTLYYRQAQLRSRIHAFNDLDIKKNPRPMAEEITMDLVEYLVQKATSVRSAYYKDSTKVGMLELSLMTHLLADSVYSAFQSGLAYDDLKLSLLEAAPIPYTDMLEEANQLFQITGESRFVHLAHKVMEHSRAVVLKGALTRVDSFEKLGLPTNLVANEKALLHRRSNLLVMLGDKGSNQAARDSLNEAIITLNSEYDRLKVAIANDQPNYLWLRFGSDVGLDRLSTLMAQKRALWLEYYWSDSKIYVLVVGPSRASLHSVPISAELMGSLKRVSHEVVRFGDSSFTRKSFKSYTSDAYMLFEKLVAPSIESFKANRLIISASGPLMSFPFEALVLSQPDSDEVDFRLDYMINHFDISYQYASFFLDHESTRSRHGDKLLAVGHAATDTINDTETDLPGARKEIETLRGIMTNSNNKYLLQEHASELEFKTNAEQFNLLHLAVHGVADSADAMNSHLIFRAAGGDSEDGKLFASELYTLDLRQTDLTVLTACESGLGKVQTGEGIMSIARGFAYAGCPSMIVSLWKVSDKTSPVIMNGFYGSLSKGDQIDIALGNAKRTYLQQTSAFNAHPSSWAAFLAVGDTTAVTTSSDGLMSYFVLAALSVLMILWWRVRKIRASRLQLTHQQG
jgi:CHAT domain-containing protein/tetratricopeptide (TPR) repeat protein